MPVFCEWGKLQRYREIEAKGVIQIRSHISTIVFFNQFLVWNLSLQIPLRSESQPIAGEARKTARRKDVVISLISALDAHNYRPYKALRGIMNPNPKNEMPTVTISTRTGIV